MIYHNAYIAILSTPQDAVHASYFPNVVENSKLTAGSVCLIVNEINYPT